MNGAQVGVLEKTNQIGLASFLQHQSIISNRITAFFKRGTNLEGPNCGALEAHVSLELLGNFSDETLEGELADQKLGRLLITADLLESHSARSEPTGLPHFSI
jgi:hypothetical protein